MASAEALFSMKSGSKMQSSLDKVREVEADVETRQRVSNRRDAQAVDSPSSSEEDKRVHVGFEWSRAYTHAYSSTG